MTLKIVQGATSAPAAQRPGDAQSQAAGQAAQARAAATGAGTQAAAVAHGRAVSDAVVVSARSISKHGATEELRDADKAQRKADEVADEIRSDDVSAKGVHSHLASAHGGKHL